MLGKKHLLCNIFLVLSAAVCPAQFTDDFTDGNFHSDPRWSGDTARFIVNGSAQLQLSAPAQEDTSVLAAAAPLSGALEWRFWVKLAFSPSDNNYVRIYLLADTEALAGPVRGYYILMGENGSADGVDLWRQDGDQHTLLMDGRPGRAAGSSNTIRIRVVADAGQWTVYSDTLGGDDVMAEGTAFDTAWTAGSALGVFCRYTKSNAAAFYFDDFYAGPVVEDTDAPRLLRAEVSAPAALDLFFSETVDKVTAENPARYTASRGAGSPLSALRNAAAPSSVHLTFSAPFAEDETYTITAAGIADVAGNGGPAMSAVFSWHAVKPGDIVISEVLFNPKGDGADFVELFNRSRFALDLGSLRLATVDRFSGKITSVREITGEQHLFFPAEYRLLTDDAAMVAEQYPGACLSAFLEMPSLPSYNNDSGVVVLVRSDSLAVDRLDYREDMHFPLIEDPDGISLERISHYRASDDPTNWHSASETAGFATPGCANSQQAEGRTAKGEVEVRPQIFSPDNDGYDDTAGILYRFGEAGRVGNVTVFDAKGRPVRRLANTLLLGSEGTISWDGITDRGEKAPAGIYVVLFESFTLSGEVDRRRLPCVVAARLER